MLTALNPPGLNNIIYAQLEVSGKAKFLYFYYRNFVGCISVSPILERNLK
jgi:hypothetical protein